MVATPANERRNSTLPATTPVQKPSRTSPLRLIARLLPTRALRRLRLGVGAAEAALQVVEDEARPSAPGRSSPRSANPVADDEDAALDVEASSCVTLPLTSERQRPLEQVCAAPANARAAASSPSVEPRRSPPGRRERQLRSATRSRSDRRVPGRRPSRLRLTRVQTSTCASESGPSSPSSSPTAAPTSPRWWPTSPCSRSCRSLPLAVTPRSRPPRRRVGLPREGAERAFPSSSLESILSLVHQVQDNAATLGSSAASPPLVVDLALQCAGVAFNIVYGRPNRSFLQGKGSRRFSWPRPLIVALHRPPGGALGVEVLKRYAPGFVGSEVAAYVLSIAVSLLGVFAFVLARTGC